jgi:hypothetical protein
VKAEAAEAEETIAEAAEAEETIAEAEAAEIKEGQNNNFDTYISKSCIKLPTLLTSDGYALTEEGKKALERISVSYKDTMNTVTQMVWRTIKSYHRW